VGKEYKVKVRVDGKETASGVFKKVALSIAAVTAAVVGMVKVFKTWTAAATVQEDAIVALDSALIPLGEAAAGVSRRLQEQASALQKVTKFGDETIIKGQALIASFTKNEEEIKKATAAAIDLSAAVGIDLNAAFLLMGKAAKGETSTLSRYGVILDKGIPQTEKFAEALRLVNEQFGGRAAEVAKSYSGVTQQISNAYGDLLEKLGEAFIKNKEVLASMTSIRDLLTSGGLVDAVTSFATFLAEATTATIQFGVALKNIGVGAVAAASGVGDWNAALQQSLPNLKLQIQGLKEIADAYLNLPRALREYGAALSEQREAEKLAAEAAKELADRQRDAAIASGKLVLPVDELTTLVAEYGKEAGKSDIEIKKLVANFKTMAAAIGDASTAYAILIGNQERANRIQSESAEALSLFRKDAERLGIVLEMDVTKGIKENNEALERARQLYDAGVISLTTYENAVDAVGKGNKDLADSLTGVKEGANDTKVSLDNLGRGAREAVPGIERLARSHIELADSIKAARAASQAFDPTRGATSTLSGAQDPLFANLGSRIGGGQFTFVGRVPVTQPDGRVVVV
jgi:hypothetical protein